MSEHRGDEIAAADERTFAEEEPVKLLSMCVCVLFVSAAAVFAAPGDHEKPTLNPNLPTLWIIGDSTVRNGTKGEVGWGDPIKALFDRSRLNVENRALGGRSSRSFRVEGLWQKVLDDAKPGDFVLMQFGHNDSGPLDDTARPRASIHGMGEDTKVVNKKDGTDETVHTFGWYMEQYIKDAKAKGMTPIVCSYIPRCPRPDHDKPAEMPKLPVEPTSYALWAKQAAEAEQVQFISLNCIIWNHYAGLTPDELKAKYFTPADWTHTNPAGAELNAKCVVEGLRDLKDCKLNDYVLASK